MRKYAAIVLYCSQKGGAMVYLIDLIVLDTVTVNILTVELVMADVMKNSSVFRR